MNLSLPAFFDILIGLTFIYLILSLLASEIQELITAFLQFRAKHLKESIYILFGGTENSQAVKQSLKGLDEGIKEDKKTVISDENKKAVLLTKKLYTNSIIASLTQSNLGFGVRKQTNVLYGPSYIPSETFASAFLDILGEELNIEKFSRFKLGDQEGEIPKKLQHHLYELATRAKLKVKNNNHGVLEIETYQYQYQLKKEFEKWYDHSQNRTSGTYKRNTKFVLFWIGLITAVFANANAFHIVSSLYHQGTVRNVVTQAAVNAVDNCKELTDPQKAECLDTVDTKIKETIEVDQLPLGWKTGEDFFNLSNFYNLPGWIVSAFAITMGAPFWFDLLNKFVNVRNAGPKPPSSTES